MIIDNLVDADEAWRLAKEGWFLTSGGYVYSKFRYFSYGTFPSCLRSGPVDKKAFRGRHWRKLSFEDLIKHVGYFPDSFYNFREMCKDTPYEEDAINNEVNMIHYMIDSPYSTKDFRNTFKTEEIWEQYFNPKDMDNDTGSSIS